MLKPIFSLAHALFYFEVICLDESMTKIVLLTIVLEYKL